MSTLDLRRLTASTSLEADVCIVGAGPAGLTLATELAGSEQQVVLLESGGTQLEPWSQQLNDGTTGGDPYAGLRLTRHRQTGGTAHLWNTPLSGELGAKYAPLDPEDFAAQPGDPDGAWPIEHSALVSWYQRAQAFCGLGPFEYEGAYWSDRERSCFDFGDGELTSRVYQFGSARPFIEAYLRFLAAARKVRLCPHATVCALRLDRDRHQVLEAAARTPNGIEHRVRARTYVLAGGAVENARLLLLAGVGNCGGWVGRCFMEHPRDSLLTLLPTRADFRARAAFYDSHRGRDGTVICGRFALGPERRHSERLPNLSVTLLPRAEAAPRSLPLRMLDRLLGPGPRPGGYGWSRAVAKGPDAFQLLLNLEQRPHPDNRILLSTDTDPFGVPRAALEWRWRPHEAEGLARARSLIAGALERAGLGRVVRGEPRPLDPNAHHHSGTTRMHPEPEGGVVDADGKVHGTRNLYVAGASVFPSAGFANPTLTIVALALRLAERLGAAR